MEDQPDEANECQVNTQPDKREGSYRAFPIFLEYNENCFMKTKAILWQTEFLIKFISSTR